MKLNFYETTPQCTCNVNDKVNEISSDEHVIIVIYIYLISFSCLQVRVTPINDNTQSSDALRNSNLQTVKTAG